jgi:hypothetical protein
MRLAVYGYGQPFRKASGYSTLVYIPDGWTSTTCIDKTLHRNLRRVIRNGLSNDLLALHEPAILRNIEVYFSELTEVKDSEGWSLPSDMRAWSKH